MLKKTIVVVVAVLWMGMASTAQASTVAFANTLGQGGGQLTFSTLPGGTLSVTNAVISGVENQDTAVFSLIDSSGLGSCGAVGLGCLTFTTGAWISSDATTQTATYSPVGSSLTITGDATAVAGEGNLLYSSAFLGNIEIQRTGSTATVQGLLIGGALDPVLAAFLGVLPTPLDGNANSTAINVVLTFNGLNVTGGSGMIALSDVVLTTVDTPQDVVPEPGSLLLLGTGLFGAAASVRRRLRSRRQ